MSEEIKNTETKETKRPRGKKSNNEIVEQTVEQVVEQNEETIVEEVVETEVEVEEQIVEKTHDTQMEQVVEQPKENVVEKPTTETFDIQAIKREAIRYNHCVFTYSDGFICHAVSRSKADIKHNAWLNRK